MKQLVLIISSFAMLVVFGACTQEQPASVDTAAEAEKNALEAERAEEELAKLADLQRQSDGHKKGSRKPASTNETGALKALNAHAGKTQPKVAVANPKPQPTMMNVATSELAGQSPAVRADVASKRNSVYVLQVGSFRVKENAVNLEAKLKSSGFPVRLKEMNHSKNGQLFVVQFEPTPNKAEADEWRSQVKEKVSLDGQVLARPE